MKIVKKKILCLFLCILLLLPAMTACSKPPAYAEIEGRFRELVEASQEINLLFFGEGLPTYERVTDPRSSTTVYEDEATGQRYHYYELEDETLGRIIAFRLSLTTKVYRDEADGVKYYYYEIYDETYGRVIVVNSMAEDGDLCLQILSEPKEGVEADYVNEEKQMYGYAIEDFTYEQKNEYTYLQVLSAPKEDEEPYYSDEAKRLYCYELTDYKEPTYESFYSADDPTDYDYVTADSKYLSVDQIKTAAEQVYSTDYLNAIYDTMFVGSLGAVDSVSGLSARYIEYADENGTVSLMMSNTYEPLVREVRQFDFSTAQMVKPSNGSYVNITVDTYLPSDPSNILNIRVSLILQNGVWMLDSGTY